MRLALGDPDSGQIAVKSILTGGIGLIAIIAALWIGGTASGLGSDTAKCITTVNKSAAAPSSKNPCAADNNAMDAHATNADTAVWQDRVGDRVPVTGSAADNAATAAAVAQAESNLERGLLRFGGLKMSVYEDARPYLIALQSATTKTQALNALESIKSVVGTARADGETYNSSDLLQTAANLLRSAGHPAYDSAQRGQQLAATGNGYMTSAVTLVNEATNNSSLSLAQLKSYSSSIGDQLLQTKNYYPAALGEINTSLGIIRGAN